MNPADESTARIAALPAPLRDRLSALTIELADAGGWQARLSYALMVQSPLPGTGGSMPAGVTLAAWERWPDNVLALSAVRTEADILAAIRALEQSGLVGHLDLARVSEHHEDSIIDRYIVKTHAGSDEERRAWAFARNTVPK
ncbi:MAG: hypothetical protein HY725_11815 [Candidatus Rokubacteria bacterium]|nr:hypothetical protein [Candidatus Rokubacteria bacterium]